MRNALLRCGAVLLVGLSVSCDDAGRDGSSDPGDAQADGTRYSRQMIFVASDGTAAALLDYATIDAGPALRRTARGWAEGGSGWIPLYDLAWEGASVRRPWRLVPHGPLRVRVGLADEIEGLSVRDEETELLTLENGDFLAEWDPATTTQVVLRTASLALGGEPMTGWLIDARFGVARAAETEDGDAPEDDDTEDGVAPAAELPQELQDTARTPQDTGRTSQDTAGTSQDTARTSQDTTPTSRDTTRTSRDTTVGARDTLTPPDPVAAVETSTALRVHSLRGVLVGDDGETLVLLESDAGIAGWFWSEDDELTLPIVTMTETAAGGGGWSIEAGGGTTLSGTIEVLDEEAMPLAPRMVRGTLRIDGVNLEMHGVLRPDDSAE